MGVSFRTLGGDSPLIVPIAFDATRYTASGGGGGTWTLVAADIQEEFFWQMGKLVGYSLSLDAVGTIAGTPNSLNVALPFTPLRTISGTCNPQAFGAAVVFWRCQAGVAQLQIRTGGGTWTAAFAEDISVQFFTRIV